MKVRDSIYNAGNDYPQWVIIRHVPPVPPEPPVPGEITGNLIYNEDNITANFIDGSGNVLIYVEPKQ